MGGLNSADGGYFDIVIWNPPYVFTRDVDFGLDFKRYVQDAYFSRLAKDNISIKTKANQLGKINLFALLILNGKNLLNNNGTLNIEESFLLLEKLAEYIEHCVNKLRCV